MKPLFINKIVTLKKIGKCEQGAAVVETAFSILAFLILILGLIQATLVIHAKYLVNYAAYSAARAGIVHNGDLEKMKQAASLALTPLYAGSVNLADLALGYGEARLRAEVPPLLGGIKVEILSPPEERFSEEYNQRFFPELRRYDEHPVRAEDIQQLRENLLTVKVSAGFQLKIPLINTIMSPFFFDPVSGYPVIPVRSTCQMRMQSDAFTQNEEGN